MNKTILSLAAIVAMSSSFAAFAQQKAPDAAATPAPSSPVTPPAAPNAKPVTIPSGVFYKGQQVDQYSAKERLIGAKVFNKAGELIGDIEDLLEAVAVSRIGIGNLGACGSVAIKGAQKADARGWGG